MCVCVFAALGVLGFMRVFSSLELRFSQFFDFCISDFFDFMRSRTVNGVGSINFEEQSSSYCKVPINRRGEIGCDCFVMPTNGTAWCGGRALSFSAFPM